MAESFGGIVVHGWRQAERELKVMEARSRRAMMWALRETGRVAAREARKAAPVLSGPGKVVTGRRFGPQVNMETNRPVPGLLRASIRPGKRLIRTGSEGGYLHRVAPRGNRVHLYSGKIEGRVGYMARGGDVAEAKAESIAMKAMTRATRTGRGR